jgi:hypothetical protein
LDRGFSKLSFDILYLVLPINMACVAAFAKFHFQALMGMQHEFGIDILRVLHDIQRKYVAYNTSILFRSHTLVLRMTIIENNMLGMI